MKNIILIFCVLVLFSSCNKGVIKLDNDEIKSFSIIVPDSANSIVILSAEELKKHIDLLFKSSIKIVKSSDGDNARKKFLVGIKPGDYKNRLNKEGAVYVIRKNEIYLFGDDAIKSRNPVENPERSGMMNEALNMNNRTGTLFAVYNFIEKELGIRWLKPGDDGIFCTKANISLLPGISEWTPSLKQRNIRVDSFSKQGRLLYGKYAPKEFALSDDQVLKKQTDLHIWLRRMRLGKNENFRFGHAYTDYWNKYKNTNPGIFALNVYGERKPIGRIERIKMCPVNPDLPVLIVNEWRNSLKDKSLPVFISISGCENDSDGKGNDEWCHCEQCMEKDARQPGEQLVDYVTDRYVYLWNSILREARKYDKNILVTGYAYENMLQPPRREKLDDGILIEFIPRMGGNFDITRKLYEGWENAGMKRMMYRPNDMNWEIGIPMGQEERLFSNYKLAIEHNAIGTDFDSMLGFWEGISDMAYYTLSKGQYDPQARFDSLENEFLECFGEARDYIEKYYKHWRNIFNNKILPEELRLNDGINTYFLEWHKLYRLTARIDEFYSEEDFNITDSYLNDALNKNISEQVRHYIERMKVSNQHSRLTYFAFLAGKKGDRKEIVKAAGELIDFRVKNKDVVDINWNVLFQYQHYQMDDQIGTRYLGFLPENLNPDEF